MRRVWCAVSALLFVTTTVLAAADHALEEVTVTAARSPQRVLPPSLSWRPQSLDERAPVTVADVFRAVPGVQTRANSRGETVVRVRGGEERQTAVFLDGGPLATPWDGRIDLSLLPASVVRQVDVYQGAVPLEFGANAIAGVVDLSTRSPPGELVLRAELALGELGRESGSVVGSMPASPDLTLQGAIAYGEQEAERIADPRTVPFDPAPDRRRTNTDQRSHSALLAVQWGSGDQVLRLSWLGANAERGIAAQGDLDPAVSAPRYWRNPQWQLSQPMLSAHWAFNERWAMRLSAWQQSFDQTILAYRDNTYAQVRARERDLDRTLGARAVLSRDSERSGLRLSLISQTSTHTQRDAASATGLEADMVEGATLRYRQQQLSLGVEYDRRLAEEWSLTLGAGRDWFRTPLTGDKPAQPDAQAAAYTAALRWRPTETSWGSLSLGRRSRFPTLRELFGESLGRFLINTELVPETGHFVDLQFSWRALAGLRADVTLWGADIDDVIGQRVVRVEGLSRRQRYNQPGYSSAGVESRLEVEILDDLKVEASAAWRHDAVQRAVPQEPRVLLQRPRTQYSLALDWQATSRTDLRAELYRGGAAHDLADDGILRRLPPHVTLALRAYYECGRVGPDLPVLAFLAADNITDALVLPQLGFPSPGRSILVGVRVGGR